MLKVLIISFFSLSLWADVSKVRADMDKLESMYQEKPALIQDSIKVRKSSVQKVRKSKRKRVNLEAYFKRF